MFWRNYEDCEQIDGINLVREDKNEQLKKASKAIN